MYESSWISCAIAKNGQLSAAADLKSTYETMVVVFPATMDNATITIRAAMTLAGTYQDVYVTDPADGGNNKLISATTTGGITWVAPIGGLQYIKLYASASQSTATVTFYLKGVRT